MCGRFTITLSKNDVKSYIKTQYQIDVEDQMFHTPDYNIAPGQNILACLYDGKSYRVGMIKWGLMPFESKKTTNRFEIINVKSETIFDKNIFKPLVQKQRIIIFSDGFYEWKNENGHKIPYYIRLKTKSMYPMAGIRSVLKLKNGDVIHSCAILTTHANPLMKNIHHRMPVILTEETAKIWLKNDIHDKDKVKDFFTPFHHQLMEAIQVSSYVNHSKNNDATCIDAVL